MNNRLNNNLLVITEKEKAKRAAELVIANVEKAKRAAELVIANEELAPSLKTASTLGKTLTMIK